MAGSRGIDSQEYDLACSCAIEPRMEAPHRHPEVDLTYVESGEVQTWRGAAIEVLPARRLLVVWSAIPHQAVASAPGTRSWTLTLPLASFLRMQLPAALVEPVLDGRVVADPRPCATDADLEAMRRWAEDLRQVRSEARRIVELEVEARLRRLASALAGKRPPPPAARTVPRHPGWPATVEAMVVAIARGYRDGLDVPTVARSAGLHPKYAMNLFRRHLGGTILASITEHRLAHAERLLAIGEQSVLTIALDAGFASPSAFYAAFRQRWGCSPLAYRTRLRGDD